MTAKIVRRARRYGLVLFFLAFAMPPTEAFAERRPRNPSAQTRSATRQRRGVPRGSTAARLHRSRQRDTYVVTQANGTELAFHFARPALVSRAPRVRLAGDTGSREIRAVVFDIDGTLVDTRTVIRESLETACRELGVPVEPEFIESMTQGRPYSDISHIVVERYRALLEREGELTPARAAELAKRFERVAFDITETAENMGRARPYPHVVQFLRQLRGRGIITLAATSRPTSAAMNLLSVLGLTPYLNVVVGKQHLTETNTIEVGFYGAMRPGREMDGKPSPASLLYALELAGGGHHPGDALYVGDMNTDLIAAHGAGMSSAAITHGMGSHESLAAEQPDVVVHSIRELQQRLGLR